MVKLIKFRDLGFNKFVGSIPESFENFKDIKYM